MYWIQWLAASLYLFNKIFFVAAERKKLSGSLIQSRYWRIAAWSVYLLGLPPWVIIFVDSRNWIAASVEASALPAMFLGLVVAIRGINRPSPRWLDYLAMFFIPVGFAISLYDFGGFNTINQWLETGMVFSFVVGTYLLAKEKRSGYAWYVMMHITCGWLMMIQGYPWLFFQQIASLGFVVDAYRISRKKVIQN